MSEFGMKTSKLNTQVITASIVDLQFTSSDAALKIYKILTLSVNIPANTAAQTVTNITKAHGLVGGTPAYLPFVSYNGVAYPIQKNLTVSGVLFQFDSFINATNITILVYNVSQSPGSATIFDFKIYVFVDRLA